VCIYLNVPLWGGGVSANVIWQKKYVRGEEEKEENVKENEGRQ
jgi:hypothetical protein